MTLKKKKKTNIIDNKITQEKNYSLVPLIQYILFVLLVCITPFVFVTKFMLGGIHQISHASWNLFGLQFPVIGTLTVVALIFFLIWQRRKITKKRIIGSMVVIAMILLGHIVQDVYYNICLYDLQMNWHYITYGAYIFMFFQAFNRPNSHLPRVILAAFFSAVGLSVIDEIFQLLLTMRVFDVSDIAKDAWGAAIGFVLMFFVTETHGTKEFNLGRLIDERGFSYLRNPCHTLLLISILALTLLLLSPLLTDHAYIATFIISWVAFILLVLGVIHLIRHARIRIALISLLFLSAILLSGSFLKHRKGFINFASPNLIVYKGIPFPFFDLMIYPNGMPRLSDKKTIFNDRDHFYLLGQDPDILLIGCGFPKDRSMGKFEGESTLFVYNPYTGKATQKIILNTSDACKIYNQMRKEEKNVMFVIHSSGL